MNGLTDLGRLELEEVAAVLLEYFENEDFEGLRGEEVRLANKVARVLGDHGLLPEDDEPLDAAGGPDTWACECGHAPFDHYQLKRCTSEFSMCVACDTYQAEHGG